MSDTIYRQAAIDALCLACGHDCDKSKFVYNAPQDEQVIMCPEHYALSTLPSAQSEIIHCRECKYKMLDTSGDEWICSHPSNNAWRITANHYCGYAEGQEE